MWLENGETKMVGISALKQCHYLQIIEESEDRLTEEQVEELISLVELHLPDPCASQIVNGQITN